ncbi:MAG: DUF433 domain-containing protein [Sulfuritalea sp.]|nr:DUF433 domain-containing protein [Sulfuritalea sp.]
MNASLLNRITIEAGKCGGKPCIRGMRIRVSDIHRNDGRWCQHRTNPGGLSRS